MDLKERAPATDQPESTEQSLNLLDQKQAQAGRTDLHCEPDHVQRRKGRATKNVQAAR